MPMKKFEPTDQQREIAAALSAAKMPLEKIAASIVNPRTGRQISVKTLRRMFKDQLDAGVATIVEAYRGLRKGLAADEPWAVRYAFDHLAEFKAKQNEITTTKSVQTEIQNISVNFPDWIGPGPGPEPKLIEHSPVTPVNEPKPGETIPARTIAAPASLLPGWRHEDDQLREAARPAKPADGPTSPNPEAPPGCRAFKQGDRTYYVREEPDPSSWKWKR